MKLSADQKYMLEGKCGPAIQMAMRMLTAVGRATDADCLIPVSSSHVVLDSFPLGEAGAEWLEEIAASGAKFVVPTTVNSISVDRRSPDQVDEIQDRIIASAKQLGALMTCSCNPFSQGIVPIYGETLAWSESATAPYLNSVVGARTNREGASAIASALTGLTPRYGMHLDENRAAGTYFKIEMDLNDIADYHVLGSMIARRTDTGVPALQLRTRPSSDELFVFGSSLAFLSNLAMYHVVGLTPEAANIGRLFSRGEPEATVLTHADLAQEFEKFRTAESTHVDIVALGQPHASFPEICRIEELLGSRKVNSNVQFLISTNQSVLGLVAASGTLSALQNAGVDVVADRMCFACDLGPEKFSESTVVATNSVKLAHNAPGTRGVSIHIGSTKDCVEAAVSGRWM